MLADSAAPGDATRVVSSTPPSPARIDPDATIVYPSPDDYPATYSDELVEYLTARAVPPHVALARGYRDVKQGKPGKSSDDEDYATTYGFPRVRGGILIPFHPLLGEQKYQLRHYPADRVNTKRVPKFITPRGQANCLVTSPVIAPEELQKERATLFIAEGVTRVDALAGYDVPAVGISAVWGWRGKNELGGSTAIPDFEELAIKGSRQIIALDGDIKTNPKVAQAGFRLKAYLLAKGADTVRLLVLPNGEGLDDWIARERFESQRALLDAIKRHCLDDEQEADLAKSLSVSRRGEALPNTSKGLAEGLKKLNIKVRKNERTLATEWNNGAKPPPGEPEYQLLTGYKKQDIISQLEEEFTFSDKHGPNSEPVRYQLSRALFNDRMDFILYHNTVDPFREWIESLPEWDGVPRLDTLFVDALGVPDDPLARAAAKILIVAIRRCFKEWKYDHVPILIGKQGVGKTTFVRHLVPQGPDYASWFADAVELGGKEKELQEKAGGAVVVELSEMASIKAAGREHLKTLITQTASTVRLSFRRDAERHDRRYIMMGTANPSDYSLLPYDYTGYRRFIPLYVADTTTYKFVTKYLDANRGQLWAEAYARHQAGEKTHLSKELERETSKRASDLAPPDVVGSAVEDLTRKMVGTGASIENTTVNLMAEAGLVEKDKSASAPKALRTEFTGKMLSEGWTYKATRFNGNSPKKVWCVPDTLSARLQAIEVVGGQDDDDTIERCYVCSEPHAHPDKTANRLPTGKLRCDDTAKCSQRATTPDDKGE